MLFVYDTTSKGEDDQERYAIGAFVIVGIAVLATLAWMIYRLVLFIRHDLCGIKPVEEVEEKSVPSKFKTTEY